MYRIELAPGEVTVFRTIEELVTGVRNGLITSKARIYHGASEKWLPIAFHPHYKRALDIVAGRTVEPATPKPAERPRNEPLTFLNVPLTPSPPAAPPTEPTAAAPAPETALSSEPEPPTAAAPARMQPDSAAHTALLLLPSLHSISSIEPAGPMTSAGSIETSGSFETTGSSESTSALEAIGPTEVAVAVEGLGSTEIADVFEEGPADEAPPGERAEGPSLLPQVSSSPVMALPRITYPEFTPREQPVATRPGRLGRPRALHLGAALVLLVLAGYGSTRLLSVGQGGDRSAASTAEPAAAPASPAATTPATRTPPATGPQPASAPTPKSAGAPHVPAAPGVPAADAPLPPASSGFAPALEPRAIVSAPIQPPPSTASDSAADSTTAAPPPIDTKITVPVLSDTTTLVGGTRPKSDSAMKQILRAVSGGKGASPQR